MIVRLKEYTIKVLIDNYTLFQFYDSPIKSKKECSNVGIVYLFQFYDSPIKSPTIRPPHPISKWFQFYDSPIKRDGPRCRPGPSTPFQFYDSPIKRSYSSTPSKCELGFNSMIVRLKVQSLCLLSPSCFCSFNSMIVRLKAPRVLVAI